jgi:hypothetical protein
MNDHHQNLLEAMSNHNLEECNVILKAHLEEYAAEKDKDYREQNAEDLKALSTLALTEGLPMIDVVVLHKALTLDAHKETLAALLATASSSEVVLSEDEFNTLKDTYYETVAFQRAKFLFDVLKDNLIAQGVIEGFKSNLINRFDASTSSDTIKAKALDLFKSNEPYTKLMIAIRPIRDHKTPFMSILGEFFEAKRELMIIDLANSVMSELDQKSKEASHDDSNDFGVDNWVNVSQVDLSESQDGGLVLEEATTPGIVHLMKSNESTLQTFDTNSTGIASLNVSQLVNENENFKVSPCTLSEEELIELHQELQQQKAAIFIDSADEDDKVFVEKYVHELHAFREGNEHFKGRLFYRTKELLETFKQHNNQLLREVL